MTQKEITRKLKALQSVEPNAEYARLSRHVILSSKTGLVEQPIRQNIFSRGLSFALSVALTAAFLLVLALGSNAGPFKTFFLPTLDGVNNESLVSEADTITEDINIHLSEIEYFEQTRRTVALAEDPTLSADSLLDGEDEIDKLLDEIIEY